MTNAPIEMSEDEFDCQYPLLKNHLNPNASWVYGEGPGCLFETYGEELPFVRQQDPSTVWTLVDGDDGHQYVISGYHFVNRIGYLISTVSVPQDADIQVHIPMEADNDDPQPAIALPHSALQPDTLFTSIARTQLRIPTLEARRSDSLDFHDVAVWQVKAALQAAFDAGVRAAGQNQQPNGTTEIPAARPLSKTPLSLSKGTPLIPGKQYLRLYHGRTDPNQEMDRWGFDGPTFGPLSCYVHTYCSTFRIHAESGHQELWLETHDDMIRWDGCYYGDLEVFIAKADDKA
jgi:hypothetical protein